MSFNITDKDQLRLLKSRLNSSLRPRRPVRYSDETSVASSTESECSTLVDFVIDYDIRDDLTSYVLEEDVGDNTILEEENSAWTRRRNGSSVKRSKQHRSKSHRPQHIPDVSEMIDEENSAWGAPRMSQRVSSRSSSNLFASLTGRHQKSSNHTGEDPGLLGREDRA